MAKARKQGWDPMIRMQSTTLGMLMPHGPEVAAAIDTIDWARYRTQSRAGRRPQAPGGRQRSWEPGIPTGLGSADS